MTNPYLKHSKFGNNSGSHNFLTDQYNLISDYWDADPIQATKDFLTTSPVPIQTGTDGWATYFWDSKKKRITYVNPSSGQKVTVKPSNSGAWKAITSNVKWKSSTAEAMKSQKSQAPIVSSTSIAPIDSMPSYMTQEEEGFVGKSVQYAKDNPVVAGGIGLGVLTVLGLGSMLAFGGGSANEETIYIMDAESGATIGVPANATRWTYTVEFQDDEKYGPYVVTAVKTNAEKAKLSSEATYESNWEARSGGERDVERFRENMGNHSNPYGHRQ